jgi:hypothetical protein
MGEKQIEEVENDNILIVGIKPGYHQIRVATSWVTGNITFKFVIQDFPDVFLFCLAARDA